MRRALIIAAVVVSCGLTASPALAQVTVGADVALNSRYMFWGLTLSNRPVVQADVYVTVAGFTAGVWGNLDATKQNDLGDLTTGGNRSGITEVDYWAEYNRTLGPVAAKLGVIRWTYSQKNTGTLAPYATQATYPGLKNGPDINSTEIYGALTFTKVPLSPNIALYYDADIYKGFFGWVSISRSVPIASKSITLGALVGGSTSESNTGSSDIPLFVKEGITHFDFSASSAFAIGMLSLTPNAHFQINNDDATKITSRTQSNGKTVFTVGATASWSRVLRTAKPAEGSN
jgi:uncharacterized protein Gcw-chp